MKYTVVIKFIAILLAACALVTIAGSAIGVALVDELKLYSMDLDAWSEQELRSWADRIAERLANRYAAWNLGNCSAELLNLISREYMYTNEGIGQWYGLSEDSWGFSIKSGEGNVLDSSGINSTDVGFYGFTFYITPEYPVEIEYPDSTDSDAETSPTDPPVHTLSVSTYDDGSEQVHYIRFDTGPVYAVTVILPNATLDYHGIEMEVIRTLYAFRYAFIAFLIVGFLVFAVCIVYLCCAAGKTAKDAPVVPGGLNRLPLDLYALAAFWGSYTLVWLTCQILYAGSYAERYSTVLVLVSMIGMLIALLAVGFIFAIAAQCKTRGFYWWRHSVIGWIFGKLWRGVRLILRGIHRLFLLLPLIWQWLLTAGVLGFSLLYALAISYMGDSTLLILVLLISAVIACYGGYAFGTLLKGAKQMAEGELSTKVPTKYLLGAYSQCAQHLNALADAATVAAEKQLRSERMKTELITNVSHDIKTPLTSIINYVDLLQKTDDPEMRQQYLEVLNRQSQQMKKLIEDLMEMSKATTGNMPVEIARVDAVEAVTQALGEFTDKLTGAQLTSVFSPGAESMPILADGRLTWRVLSNLLSNVVKYAQPGTRFYVDLQKLDSRVLISLKNVSREALNISADELTERFVRGDASRNTEGSGLGLNIAKSLMELRKGELALLVDGDLFKVTLSFPAA